jgi:glutamine amidotransferase/cyclase
LPPLPTSPPQKLIFPGVGSFGSAMRSLHTKGLYHPLIKYIQSGRPYFGICIGMQALFQSSLESPDPEEKGLGIVPAKVTKFSKDEPDGGRKSVPHMGWNGVWKAWSEEQGDKSLLLDDESYYFVHSFRVAFDAESIEDKEKLAPFVHTLSRYGSETFVSSVRRGNVYGTQFHPEKSGPAGLDALRRWLESSADELSGFIQGDEPKGASRQWVPESEKRPTPGERSLTKRIVACLDVRSNDNGDLVVTKGDQYDVREKSDDTPGDVRNLGKPVDLARRYYHEMADEICFLNITSFRNSALRDQPMLEVVRAAAETVFVPLTVGGGIKDTVDPDGTERSALEVAGAYFRSGADKVSIGSEAVIAVEEMLKREAEGVEPVLSGKTGIETIAHGYGSQAVVVSIDPKRVYVDTSDPEWKSKFPAHHLDCLIIGDEATSNTRSEEAGKAWWYQCTIRGGREVRDVDVVQLARGVERLGAGEILLNSVDRDGSGKGFDTDLVGLIKRNVSIPVVASSGAGTVEHFKQVFESTDVEAGLAAGIFHRQEVPLEDVKVFLKKEGISTRYTELPTVT